MSNPTVRGAYIDGVPILDLSGDAREDVALRRVAAVMMKLVLANKATTTDGSIALHNIKNMLHELGGPALLDAMYHTTALAWSEWCQLHNIEPNADDGHPVQIKAVWEGVDDARTN
jgi:hypothetical protein